MDIFLLVLAGICLIVGLVGSFLPVLPGVTLGYVGILLVHFTDCIQFSSAFIYICLVVVIAVQVLDYFVPIWGTRKFGGSKKGMQGSFIGSIVGMFFGPLGVILGPFVGAILGELSEGKKRNEAFRAGWGAFVGFLLGTGIKLFVCVFFIYYYIVELINLI